LPLVPALTISSAVSAALGGGRPVVALESTVFSRLGLPAPAGSEALERSLRAVSAAGAVPALTGVVDGEACAGVDGARMAALLEATRKVGERDLGVAVAQGWGAAATTVSASLAIAAAAGIAVFATGGIGGVHRGFAETGDESADLGAIARHPVVTVCAGVKSILDISRTLERLETLGVPVIGVGTDEFPAFYSRSSGCPVPHRVGTPEEAAAVVRAAWEVGYGGGLLVAVPVPEADEIAAAELEPLIADALADAAESGVRGGAVTPFVLARIAAATDGQAVATNIALVENNARCAAALAVALAAI
jgi:pseudouridine-5'-phosphate glycosidase